MSEFKGDYMGFTYNGVHSSELGIVRVSDGSRFNENLLPTMQDKTVQVPGGDGTYYFGSYYTQRQFSISFAFDGLNEKEVAELKRHFGDKGVHDLIFDETPYKVYSAKVTGSATLKYLVFDEGGNNRRVYKGEGSIQFTCYNPFARCWSKSWDSYYTHPAYRISNGNSGYLEKTEMTDEQKNKISLRIMEWWDAAGIIYNNTNPNFGDVPVPFTKTINTTTGEITLDGKTISWNIPQEKTVILDTKTGIAKGIDGEIYNAYFTGDLTLKVPVGEKTTDLGIDFTCLYF